MGLAHERGGATVFPLAHAAAVKLGRYPGLSLIDLTRYLVQAEVKSYEIVRRRTGTEPNATARDQLVQGLSLVHSYAAE